MASTVFIQGFLSFATHAAFKMDFIAIDLIVNLMCIYLQFAFAKELYFKLCGCCDRQCRRVTQRKSKRAMSRFLSEVKSSGSPVRSIGSVHMVQNSSSTASESGALNS